jgi:polar amino acid transport system substrate-binding protein
VNIKALLCFLLTSLALHARAEVLTLSSGEWPPYLSESLPHKGVLSRIVSEAFALEGVEVRYLFRPWPRSLAEARSGEVQGSLVWSEGTPGSARNRDFFFSKAVYKGKSVFFQRKDHQITWTNFRDLDRLRIGGVQGYDYLFENVSGLRIDRAPSEELGLRMLLAGRFDIFPASADVGMFVLRTRFTDAEASRISVHPKAYNTTSYHLILPKSLRTSQRYLKIFNKGLKRLKKSGRYAKYLADFKAGRY